MGASFSLPKQWVNGEVLTHTELNSQFNTILDNVAVASGIASLDSSALTVQDPVNATATKAAGKICKWGTSEAFQCSVLTATQLVSTIADGTAPAVVTSTTKVTNLNADKLDGAEASTASSAGVIPIADGSGDIHLDFIPDTLTGKTVATATTANNLALTDEVRTDGSGTVTAAGISLLTVDLGTVTAGDRILISAKAQFNKGGTGGRSLLSVGKSSGTGTILFSSSASISTSYSTSINQEASSTHHLALTTIAAVTGTGTYVLTLNGVSAGSDSTVIANAAGIHLFFLKKQ